MISRNFLIFFTSLRCSVSCCKNMNFDITSISRKKSVELIVDVYERTCEFESGGTDLSYAFYVFLLVSGLRRERLLHRSSLLGLCNHVAQLGKCLVENLLPKNIYHVAPLIHNALIDEMTMSNVAKNFTFQPNS